VKLRTDGTCGPALFVCLRAVICLLWTGMKIGHNMCLKLDSNSWFQSLPYRQWATALLLELLYARGLSMLSERCCCVCINMTGHKRKQGNEHNFFFLFSVGVTRGTLFALQTQSPQPLPFFLLLLCQTCCSIGRGILNSSEGCYLSPISFEAPDMRNGVCVSRCYLH
jgi:hypothetical protein